MKCVGLLTVHNGTELAGDDCREMVLAALVRARSKQEGVAHTKHTHAPQAPDLVGWNMAEWSECELSRSARLSHPQRHWHRPFTVQMREDLTLLGLTALLEHGLVEKENRSETFVVDVGRV